MSIFKSLTSISNPSKNIKNSQLNVASSSANSSMGGNSNATWVIGGIGGPTIWYEDGKNAVYFGTLSSFLDTIN
ncbi:hypothetical protein CYY_001154 [Polysphondylium violaceum]|uniref:Uncharacterized protein n=1 Tax=Polysphondylium violaceum TaxID=133409 RepID=A0A8J4UWG9_9MYCE|nr:hypothetical protein CYY_001154 [Polysphondylium violaceum]